MKKKNNILGSLKTTFVVIGILWSYTLHNTHAQQAQSPWVKEFIETYNSNDASKIKGLLTEKFHKAYHNNTKYWQGVFKEFGPVDFFSMAKDSINGRALIWVRSRDTKNFVAFAYKVVEEPSFMITRMGVIRGMIPSGMTRKSIANDVARQRIISYLDDLEKSDSFSGAVLLAQGDEIILNKAVNLADRESESPIDPDTKFLIASSTKMFTAVAVAQLAEQGLLNYDDAISKYLPDYPKHIGDQVKIQHLLTHSSGIELDEISAYNKAIQKMKSLDEMYEIHLRYLPKLEGYNDFQLPEGFNYTNEGFDLAGYIVEKVTGMSFYNYLAESIFKRASMSNTGDFQKGQEAPKLAKGYTTSNSGERRVNTRYLPQRSRPAGSFYSTTADLFSFINSLRDGKLVKKETFEDMISPKISSYENAISSSQYGYGFTLNNVSGIKSWGHAGVAPGMNAECDVYSEIGFTVIVLSNYDRAASVVANYIRDLLHFDVD